jgi:hypothetical protein
LEQLDLIFELLHLMAFENIQCLQFIQPWIKRHLKNIGWRLPKQIHPKVYLLSLSFSFFRQDTLPRVIQDLFEVQDQFKVEAFLSCVCLQQNS